MAAMVLTQLIVVCLTKFSLAMASRYFLVTEIQCYSALMAFLTKRHNYETLLQFRIVLVQH